MASNLDFVEMVTGQLSEECEISYRKMFGEYAVYSKGKVVGLICENQLFIKPTDEGKAYIGDYTEGVAYKGAKPSLLIDDNLENAEWLSKLILITEKALPAVKKKSKKTPCK